MKPFFCIQRMKNKSEIQEQNQKKRTERIDEFCDRYHLCILFLPSTLKHLHTTLGMYNSVLLDQLSRFIREMFRRKRKPNQHSHENRLVK